jgi:hypothetical protein
MKTNNFFKFRIYFTVAVTVLIWALLIWERNHGGIPRHHLLNRADLPSISNIWGGILLPIITWILLYRIQVRVKKKSEQSTAPVSMENILVAFLWAMFAGVLLAVCFTYNYSIVSDNIIFVFLLLAFFVPIFYSEYILGFVLGMTFTFGVILPTAFALVIALIGWLIYQYLRPLALRLVKKSKS